MLRFSIPANFVKYAEPKEENRLRKKYFAFCALLATLAAMGVSLFCLHTAGYRVNRSASLPGYVYRLTPLEEDEALLRGDCVAVNLSHFANPVILQGVERGYVNLRDPMLKMVGGIPGDRVAISGNFLTVGGVPMPITVASADSYGGALSAWPTPLVLSPDHYWLVSDPQRGFDSRYFGPLERFSFTHKARIVF